MSRPARRASAVSAPAAAACTVWRKSFADGVRDVQARRAGELARSVDHPCLGSAFRHRRRADVAAAPVGLAQLIGGREKSVDERGLLVCQPVQRPQRDGRPRQALDGVRSIPASVCAQLFGRRVAGRGEALRREREQLVEHRFDALDRFEIDVTHAGFSMQPAPSPARGRSAHPQTARKYRTSVRATDS